MTEVKLTTKNAPVGTRAPAIMGGAWCKTEHGWKWNGPDGTGGTFPSPGGDWDGRLMSPYEWENRYNFMKRSKP
jgi:hypothetical protein